MTHCKTKTGQIGKKSKLTERRMKADQVIFSSPQFRMLDEMKKKWISTVMSTKGAA